MSIILVFNSILMMSRDSRGTKSLGSSAYLTYPSIDIYTWVYMYEYIYVYIYMSIDR